MPNISCLLVPASEISSARDALVPDSKMVWSLTALGFLLKYFLLSHSLQEKFFLSLSLSLSLCVCVCVCVGVCVCVCLCSDLLVPVMYYRVTNHSTPTSLKVQWLGLCASTAGGTGLIPGGGSKILCAVVQPKNRRKQITSPLSGLKEQPFYLLTTLWDGNSGILEPQLGWI